MSLPHAAPNTHLTFGQRALLYGAPLLMALVMWLHGPIQQWASYHHFADVHTLWGMPNAANVMSNLPFLLIGMWGGLAMWRQRQAHPNPNPSFHAWCVFAFSIACTCFGSAYYHWAPDNATLWWDRLPIAWACASLSVALLAERVNPRFGRPWLLFAAVTIATLSVFYWWWTLAPQGKLPGGDLRPYLFVQFLPMLLVLLLFGMKLAAQHSQAIPASAAWWALGLYAIAKLLEIGDHAVLESLHFIGGHPLKHLFAAAGAAMLMHAAVRPVNSRT
ncbi:MAG: ceramidase domain-containing protein [Burkholderiales bacterium]